MLVQEIVSENLDTQFTKKHNVHKKMNCNFCWSGFIE